MPTKFERALSFLRQNADAAKAEMGEEKYNSYIGKLESRVAKSTLNRSTGDFEWKPSLTYTEEDRARATQERDTAIASGEDWGTGERVPAPTGEQQVAKAVASAAKPMGKLPKSKAVSNRELIAGRQKAEAIVAEARDETLPNASKLKEFSEPPEFIGESGGPGWYLEPSVEQFHREMRDVLGDQVKDYDENTDAYKEYADMKWRQAYNYNKARNKTIKRVNFSKEVNALGNLPLVGNVTPKVARAGGAVGSALVGADEGLLLGAGKAITNALVPGAGRKLDKMSEKHPGWRTAGFIGGASNPRSVAAEATRGLAKVGGAILPKVAQRVAASGPVSRAAYKLGKFEPMLPEIGVRAVNAIPKVAQEIKASGALHGAAAGGTGAGVQSLGEDVVRMASGEEELNKENVLRAGSRAAEQALTGGAVGAPLGALMGAASAKRAATRKRPDIGPDIKRVEQIGGRTHWRKGIEPPPAVKELRQRAALNPQHPSAQGQLLSETTKELEAPLVGAADEYARAEKAAAGDLRGYVQNRTYQYRAAEAEVGDTLSRRTEASARTLQEGEEQLAGEIVDYGTSASQEYNSLIDQVTANVGRGARKFTANQREAAAKIQNQYYASTQGKRTISLSREGKDTTDLIGEWEKALKRLTDADGNPTPAAEAAVRDMHSQTRQLFANDVKVVSSQAEADAVVKQRLAAAKKVVRGTLGRPRVMRQGDARRMGLKWDEATEGTSPNDLIVVSERKVDAKGLDTYLDRYREWANLNSKNRIEYKELSNIDPTVRKLRNRFQPSSQAMADETATIKTASGKTIKLKGWAATKERVANEIRKAEKTEEAVGIRSQQQGPELDVDTQKAVRGSVERLRGGAENPELENLLVRPDLVGEGTAEQLARAKQIAGRAKDVGVEVPVPENVAQGDIGRARGVVRQGLESENPALENVLEQRGRLGQFREMQEEAAGLRRLGISPEKAGPQTRASVREYGQGAENPELEVAAMGSGELPRLRLMPQIRHEMSLMGMTPDITRPSPIGLTPEVSGALPRSQEDAIRNLIRRYSKRELPGPTEGAVRRGALQRPESPRDLEVLRNIRDNLKGFGLDPEKIKGGLDANQEKAVRSVLERYGMSNATDAEIEALVSVLGDTEKLRLLPGVRSTERLEGASSMKIQPRASGSSLWASIPLLGQGMSLRGDALLRMLTRKDLGGAGAATQERPDKASDTLTPHEKKTLKAIRERMSP